MTTFRRRFRPACRRYIAAIEALPGRIAPSGGLAAPLTTTPIILPPIPYYPPGTNPPTLPCEDTP